MFGGCRVSSSLVLQNHVFDVLFFLPNPLFYFFFWFKINLCLDKSASLPKPHKCLWNEENITKMFWTVKTIIYNTQYYYVIFNINTFTDYLRK